jgi:hypothetical protein
MLRSARDSGETACAAGVGTPEQQLFEERADVRPLRPDAARRIDRAELVGDDLGGQVERRVDLIVDRRNRSAIAPLVDRTSRYLT